MNAIALVQARMASTRLPGKMLAAIGGLPMLDHVMRRALKAVDCAVLCLSDQLEDEPLKAHWPYYVGANISPDDVLARFAMFAMPLPPDWPVVRLTGDCPLIDPWLIRLALALHDPAGITTTSPAEITGWPDGQDVEVFSLALLQEAHKNATEPYDREHVTPWIRRAYPIRYIATGLESGPKMSVDTMKDLAFVREVVSALGPDASLPEILMWAKR